MAKPIKITLFCGGRGSATIIRELLRTPNVQLNLLINAYDDGLSTGALREFIPGMLGPSDFRKNLTYLLHLHSSENFALGQLFEYRLPLAFTNEDFEILLNRLRGGSAESSHPLSEIFSLLDSMDGSDTQTVLKYLTEFESYLRGQQRQFDFSDCSFGNLIFAGAYLKAGSSFNSATKELSSFLRARAGVVNVSNGENRILVALKENGEILDRESKIVSEQSSARIREIFLLPSLLSAETLQELEHLDFEAKRKRLKAAEAEVRLSKEAKAAIAECDVLMYGPGTQFSSLFPSYRTASLGEVVAKSEARLKIMVANLHHDQDIQSHTAEDLLGDAIRFLRNGNREIPPECLVTHVFFDPEASKRPNGLKLGSTLDNCELANSDKKIQWVLRGFENPALSGVHSGNAVIQETLNLLRKTDPARNGQLEIFVDLNDRSMALRGLVQEFLEIDWKREFTSVCLTIRGDAGELPALPPHLKIQEISTHSIFPEVEFFLGWLANRQSQYFASITGDGEYRFHDLLLAAQVMKGSTFGAIHGSRTQSRRQLQESWDAAYGESCFIHALSLAGAIVISAMLALTTRVIFSDPFSGLRLFDRSALPKGAIQSPLHVNLQTPAELTGFISSLGVEIAEIPIYYKTFKGFTNVRWRLRRGFRNGLSILLQRRS